MIVMVMMTDIMVIRRIRYHKIDDDTFDNNTYKDDCNATDNDD